MQSSLAPALSHRFPFLFALADDRRVAPMLGLGFSSGLPLLLVYTTQSAWLSDARVPISTIGLLSELTLAYKLKFLWAPFLDRHDPPLVGRWLGRRRGWMILTQIGALLALAGVAFGDPANWLAWTIVFSLALGLAGASQDVLIDGWRITVAPQERQALMTSWAEIGWRIGTFAGGAGALYLSAYFSWRVAYLCMAALTLPGIVAALLAPVPESDRTRTVETQSIAKTLWIPIRELVGRLGPLAFWILVMIAAFRMPGYVSSAMAIPLFKHLSYSNADIAKVTKIYGFGVALAGTFVAGFILPRIGTTAGLVIGTVVGSASHLSLAWLAAQGDGSGTDFWLFAVSVSIDNFAYAFASIVLITYMSSLVSTEHAATQYALLTSLVALPGSFLAAGSGYVIEHLGFEMFFVATSLLGVPIAVLCLFVSRAREASLRRRAT